MKLEPLVPGGVELPIEQLQQQGYPWVGFWLESEIEAFSEAKKQEWIEEKQRQRERWLEAENQKIKASLSNQERDRALLPNHSQTSE